jgi:hypothetical protein
MELLNLIRRMRLREKLSFYEIARRTGLSRNTVKKHLNAGTVEPKFAISDRPSKLDPFADKLAAWLKSETSKPRKQRRTLKQIHSDLVALSFTGSYNRVAAFTRALRGTGGPTVSGNSKPPGAAPLFPWLSVPVRHSNSTGARTMPSSAVSAPSCRLLI